MWATQSYALPTSAAVSGVVRDIHGTPQMGALVELLRVDASSVATAFTDDHGRYLLPSVHPGKYQLRATAAFFVPVVRSNLSLHAGAQAIVNLTMSTLFEAGNWLPAQRRGPEELNDDWKWTLRSSANRPLLRLVDPETGEAISTSAGESPKADTQGRVTVVNGDGAFGYGGQHQVLMMDRVVEDGSGTIFRADLGDPQIPLTVAPSVDVLAGFQRQMFNGRTRLVTSFASHPELVANGVPGFQTMRMASAEELTLGDAVMIDAGTLIEAEKLAATRITTEPFVRVAFHVSDSTAIEYRYATGRQLQSSADLDRLKPQATVLTDVNGRPLSNKGSHHEFSVNQRLGDEDVVTIAVYRDSFTTGALMGSGNVDAEMMGVLPVVADPTTQTFRLATSGYTGRGASVTLTHKLSPSMKAFVEYEVGTALRATSLGSQTQGLTTRGHTSSAAAAGLRGKIARTGTTVNAEYRWQPVSTLTQVDAYNAGLTEAYLGFSVRQRIWGGRFLPHGMDAVLEATNLLEQGYQPVIAPDGHTLFLAQVPRAIQGGVAFNF
ncbi:MAG: carboxypeptidase-like regulatory domain-containing protein [Acidobacteriaceae bacterium]|nr:carboxypeptidase-like regulatory domain-containing protein [Acidobacteriaceae bacterium]